MNDIILIGISGKAQAGKDTVADILNNLLWNNTRKSFIKKSFAQELKDIAQDLFKWDGNKELLSEQDKGRNLLISIGNKMREIRPTVWLDYVFDSIKETYNECGKDSILSGYALSGAEVGGFIIPDVRYKNEVERIKKEGGIVIRVTRPEQLDIKNISETECDDLEFDYSFSNEGSIEQLTLLLKAFYNSHLKHRFPILDRWEREYKDETEKEVISSLKYRKEV